MRFSGHTQDYGQMQVQKEKSTSKYMGPSADVVHIVPPAYFLEVDGMTCFSIQGYCSLVPIIIARIK
jgi:hypothetical protein